MGADDILVGIDDFGPGDINWHRQVVFTGTVNAINHAGVIFDGTNGVPSNFTRFQVIDLFGTGGSTDFFDNSAEVPLTRAWWRLR